MVEGDSFLLSVRTVGIMLPLSEVKRDMPKDLGQVVGAEAEELGGLGDRAGAKSVTQVPTPQPFL